MKKLVALLLFLITIFSFCITVNANSEIKTEAETPSLLETDEEYDCRSLVLMEASSGKVLMSQNPTAALPPASVTKVMTLLLAAEALDSGAFSLDDKVTVSSYAASMGGSQVFLEEGEQISVEDLFKCTVIASANDAAVALAELVAGSEAAFVKKMNVRAMELGLASTVFENVTGLDDTVTHHVTSALDIATMSRELLTHEIITKYSSIWQDSIRDGAFTLTNTNRLVRFYDGCNGLKTGSTDAAGFCISATAKRGNMQLIAVVMGAPTRDVRNNIARELLDLGFSSYALFEKGETSLGTIKLERGLNTEIELFSSSISLIVDKTSLSKIEAVTTLPQSLSAPLRANEPVGKIEYKLDGEVIGESSIYVKYDAECIGFWELILSMVKELVL